MVKLLVLQLHQVLLQQQIARWVAPQGQFRGQGQLGSSCSGLAGIANQRGRIATQITHQGIRLDQGDPHRAGGRSLLVKP